MAFSKGIKIYTTDLNPQMNAQVDDIEYYLTNKCILNYDIDNLAYIKFDLDIDLKLNIPEGLEIQYNKALGNYVAITQEDKTWFYFIISSEWTASRTVKLKLSIDSINTFKDNLIWKDKTHIIRQHKDRLNPKVTYSTDEEFDGNEYSLNYSIKIDKKSENMDLPKIKQSDQVITEDGSNWYLMYRTANEITNDKIEALNCYLFADKNIQLQLASSASARFNYTNFIVGDYYYFTDTDNPDGKFTFYDQNGTGHTYTIGDTYTWRNYQNTESNSGKIIGLEVYRLGDDLHMNILCECQSTATASGTVLSIAGPFSYVYEQGKLGNKIQSILFTVGNFFRYSTSRLNAKGSYGIEKLAPYKLNINAGTSDKYLNTLDDIDKSDTRILKIIKLPYCPVDYTKSGNIYSFGPEWSYDSGLLKLNQSKLSLEFIHNLSAISYITELTQVAWSGVTTDDGDFKDIYMNLEKGHITDPKVYHSDFYTFKYLYDNFSKEIKLENLKPGNLQLYKNLKVDIQFKPTNTINSKFAFTIKPECTVINESDYENYLLVDRNNEETVFTNDYLNYIRNGYNYDKKSVEDNIAKSNLSAGLQFAGGLAGLLASSVTGGISAAAGISLITSSINSFTGATINEQQERAKLERKLTDLAMQSATVRGSNDIDLLTFYNSNKLHLVKYNLSYEHQKLLTDIFYYTGYAVDEYKIPDVTSRLWFNYIQCEPEFDEKTIAPYSKYVDDIKERYKKGVTVYHKVNNNYDLNQTKENWETSIHFEQA